MSGAIATPSGNLPRLMMRGICKSFPGVQALSAVDFDLLPGEVHAIIGQNGAGKTTLVKIISGAYPADAGQIFINGQEVHFHSPADARKQGIMTVHQDWNLFPELSVAENIFAGRMPVKTQSGIIDWERCYEEAAKELRSLGLDLDPRMRVGLLRPAQMQMVEIVRCICANAAIMILDEPTAALGPHEIESLFAMIRCVVAGGVSILYISHKLEEVQEIADRVTVLRDGCKVGTVRADGVSRLDLIRMMVGREVEAPQKQVVVTPGAEILRLHQVGRGRSLRDISFSLRSGEILGIFGLLGAGQKQLIDVLYGITPADTGEIWVNGRKVRIESPEMAKRLGLGLVPGDRKREGLVQTLSASANLTLANTALISFANLFLSPRRERTQSWHWINALDIRPKDGSRLVKYFSGGNQQKVVLGKWLQNNCKVLILDHPTQGVDVGAKSEIYALLEELAKANMGIILVSTELPEILAMSDRILVMRNGTIAAEIPRQEATNERLLAHATGEG
ncbi:MAG: D-xylose ABC transporter ATP-binding protein [Ardenticatenia bacterium]|jgi:ribose transport system ATP-binding protein|nr:MAG: D-xylose ABC transporter ATP-binding protein [Ardenticatenia bacterium]